MEPVRPRDREKALSTGGTEAELAEYHRLVARRFATNPYTPKSPDEIRAIEAREQRIGDLHHKLFSDV
ncbi:MAG TPA: hypothetical protein VF574_10765 [Allosphingosinicella sp.]|jgi:hypothetical protein